MMTHVHKSGEICRNTKTLCGRLLEDLPRVDGAVAYKNRSSTTCPDCQKIVNKTETMRRGRDNAK